jgi:hypothetical protein
LPFFCHLQQAESLSDWPLALYPFNPRVIANFRKSFGDLDKTDLLDAHVIAERLRFGRDLPVPFVMEALYLPLRTLTRYRYHLVRELVRVKGYTLSLVYLKASEYNVSRAQRPFDRVFSATSQAVLREFQSMEDIAAMPFDELVEWLDGKGKRRFADPEENARRLQKVAENSYQLPEEWLETVNTALSLSLRHLNTLEQLLKRLDTAIEEQMEAFPNTLTTIPGIALSLPPASSPRLATCLVSITTRSRWPASPVSNGSAARAATSRQRKRPASAVAIPSSATTCVKPLSTSGCTMLSMAPSTNASTTKSPSTNHKRALVLTARKLVRLVVRLLTTNEPYRARRVGSGNST